MTHLDKIVMVFRDRDGKVVACHSDECKQYLNGDYQHIATIQPALWIAAHYDEIHGGGE